MKSETPRSSFEAELNAEFIQTKFTDGLELYEHGKPNVWRLTSKLELISKCYRERGSDGNYKVSYPSRRKAIQKANIIHQTRGVMLYEYKCDCCDSWHLSKRH